MNRVSWLQAEDCVKLIDSANVSAAVLNLPERGAGGGPRDSGQAFVSVLSGAIKSLDTDGMVLLGCGAMAWVNPNQQVECHLAKPAYHR